MHQPESDLPLPMEHESGIHAANTSGLERLLGGMLVAGTLALAILSLGPDAIARSYSWPWVGYWHGLLALAPVAFVLGAGARRPAPRLGAALDVGLFLWAVGALAGAWFSPFRWQSMAAALLPLASVCLAYVVRGWLGFHARISRQRARRAGFILALLAAAFVLVSWVYWIWYDIAAAIGRGETWADLARLPNGHPLGPRHTTAGFVVLTGPVLVAMALTSRGAVRVAWWVIAFFALALIPTTGSDGAVLGLLAMAGGLGLYVLRSAKFSGRARLGLLLGLLGIAALLSFSNPRWRERVWNHDGSVATAEAKRQRSAALRAGDRMGADRPWVGWGPGTVSLAYPRYRAQVDGGPDNVLQLPSTPVQIWAEHGVVGVLAGVALVVGVVMRAWRLRPDGPAAQAGTTRDRTLAWGIVFALGGYAVFALKEYQGHLPLFTGVIAALLALLSALTRPAGLTDITWSPTFVRVIPAAAVAVALALVARYAWPNLQARRAFAHGVTALERGDEETFFATVRRARQLAPREPFYVNQLAVHLLGTIDHAADAARATTLRAVAIGALSQSLTLRPEQDWCHLNLGWLLLEQGEPTVAAEHFRTAARLAPHHRGVYAGIGDALLRAGVTHEDAAVRSFALEWINDPRAIAHPRWSRPEQRERRAAVLTAAQSRLAEISARDDRLAAQAAYVHALFAWWVEPSPAGLRRVLATATNDQQRTLFEAVAAKEPRSSIIPGGEAPWRILLAAWHADDPVAALAGLPREWLPWREDLARRIEERRDSFAAFLTGPGADADGLLRSVRPHFDSYGLLLRNTDGLPFVDRTLSEDNLLLALLPEEIFPPRGWIRGPALVEWLETPPNGTTSGGMLQGGGPEAD